MNGDFSRLTFDARNHYSAVLQQQGRVGLDADWNNMVEIILRRLAVETVDVIGKCGRPQDPAVGGFKVTVPSGPKMEFSKGRFYAGGLLAENAKQRDYNQQPDWPVWQKAEWEAVFGAGSWLGFDPTKITGARRDLVYLEVWDRHVTALNEEALRDASNRTADFPDAPVDASWVRERALGGPDTCTRLRTVAQVKLYAGIGNVADCGAACAKLEADRPPKTRGTMQLFVLSTPPVNKPCEEPQTGGYGGAENRLYRVQIHDPGPAGTATFKWSTENGAFTVRVMEDAKQKIPAGTAITIQSLGNDQVIQLHKGDWVELCGEETELGGFRNPVAQITDAPVAKPDGMFTVKLSAAVVVPSAPFLRRWDAPVKIITLNVANQLDDGSGLNVKFFDENGGLTGVQYFHDLDYWVWSARVGTRDVEPQALVDAPQPVRGIERHYCCLALIDWTSGTALTPKQVIDCAPEFPPLTDLPEGGDCGCCCTITVGDGKTSHGQFQTIVEAITNLPPWVDEKTPTAVICIQQGTYNLPGILPLIRDKVIIRGCGPGTIVRTPVGGFLLKDRNRVVITGVQFEELLEQPAVLVSNGREIQIRDNSFVALDKAKTPCVALAGNQIRFTGNQVNGIEGNHEADSGLFVTGFTDDMEIRCNSFGPYLAGGILIDQEKSDDTKLSTARNILIDGNHFLSLAGPAIFSTGLNLDLADVRIQNNSIVSSGRGKTVRSTIVAPGLIELQDVRHVAIVDNDIVRNNIAESTAILLGTAAGAVIRNNRVQGNGVENDRRAQMGVYVANAIPSSDDGVTIDDWPALDISGNQIHTEFGTTVYAAGFGRMRVTGNTLTRVGLNLAELKLASTVQINNSGVDEFKAGAAGFAALSSNYAVYVPTVEAQAQAIPMVGGEVLFAHNQCTLVVAKPGQGDGPSFISVRIQCLDDLGFHANQLRIRLNKDVRIDTNASLEATTLRITDNRFVESPVESFRFSCRGKGELLTATGNQSTHCLDFSGGLTAINLNLIRPQLATILKCAAVNFPTTTQPAPPVTAGIVVLDAPLSIQAIGQEDLTKRATRLAKLAKAEEDPRRRTQLLYQAAVAQTGKDRLEAAGKVAKTDANAFILQVNVSRADGKPPKGFMVSISDAAGKLKDRRPAVAVNDQGSAIFTLPAGEFPDLAKDKLPIFVRVTDATGAEVPTQSAGIPFETGKVAIVVVTA
ncbi:DUF6519 domain-containing protein [uncultured Paludibaculum sp.]|uniref:DUF6519 domain-containing protein n=1 Tax=uncultured Paludibaculum sp. TaxID=1765020 RepID=UPI002AAB7AF2|nr:DUF6519 domain-containing protein [uncultured Paludibaculum sp.]